MVLVARSIVGALSADWIQMAGLSVVIPKRQGRRSSLSQSGSNQMVPVTHADQWACGGFAALAPQQVSNDG